MEIPPDGWDDDDTISPATVVFHVGRVDLEGLTLRSASVDTENNVDSTEDGRGNKRKLTLENLCAGLLLDERVMSKSRITTSSPESPATARYAPPEFGENSSRESSIHRSVSAPNPQSVEVSNASTIDDPLQHSKRNKMTESAFTTDDEKFADADEESASRGGSQMEESTVFGLGLSQLTDEDESLQQRDHGLSSSDVNFYDDQEHHLKVNRESSPEHMSFSGQVPQDASFASQYLSDELPGLNEPARSTCSVGSQSPPAEDYDETRDAADSRKSSRGSSPVSPKPQEKSSPKIAGPSAVDDLEQLRLFTHEDTESLYMSAMGGELDESDREFRMPGGWDTASAVSSENEPERTRSMVHGRIKTDNLGTIRENGEGSKTPKVSLIAGTRAAAGCLPGTVTVSWS